MAWYSLEQTVSPLSDIRNVDSLIATDRPTYNYELPLKGAIDFTFDIEANVVAPKDLTLIPMNADQQSDVRQALTYATTVTGVPFVEVDASRSSDLVFAYYQASPQNAGVDYFDFTQAQAPSGALTTLDLHDTILLNSENAEQVSPAPGTDGYVTILHELGHALGLKHPFEPSPTLPELFDNEHWTVMSYTASPDREHPTTYSPVDLAALDWLYGGDGLRGLYGLTLDVQGDRMSSPSPAFAALASVGGSLGFAAPNLLAAAPVQAASPLAQTSGSEEAQTQAASLGLATPYGWDAARQSGRSGLDALLAQG